MHQLSAILSVSLQGNSSARPTHRRQLPPPKAGKHPGPLCLAPHSKGKEAPKAPMSCASTCITGHRLQVA
eukprot:1148362-Pelagomonas_calceolata.AAC.1